MAAKKRKTSKAFLQASRRRLMGKKKRARASRANPLLKRARRIYLDRGGYDSHGRYYGVGAPIYEVTDREGETIGIVRARDASAAKDKFVGKVEPHWKTGEPLIRWFDK